LKEISDQVICQEQESNLLMQQIKEMQASELDENSKTEEIKKLEAENNKLEYQAMHLERAIQEEQSSSKKLMDIVQKLSQLFQQAVNAAYPDVDCKMSVMPSIKQASDFQCSNAMQISGMLKKKGTKVAPREIAQNVVNCLPQNALIKSTSVAGPGFINIFIKPEFLKMSIANLLVNGVEVEKCGHKGRVVIDYSSPNIAKEMHVGHLRSTIIGDCIGNLFEFIGHDVLRLNHLGDWGTQFGMLIAHLIDMFPNYKEVSPPIQDLQTFYKQSKKRFDDDAEFKKRAYQYVVKLQSREPDVTKAWQLICKESSKQFRAVYDRLNVSKDLKERGESFYQDLMPGIVKFYEEKGMVKVEDDRKLVFIEGQSYPMTIQKSDGGFTYDTSDLAALNQRANDEKGEILLYVVDNGQASHFDLVFAAAQKAGVYDSKKTRVEHIGFGVVLGEDRKKFKTRSGTTVRLVDLLDEGLKRCEEKLMENGRNKELTEEELEKVKKSVAYGCIKYADLSHDRTNDYVFSFDRMLEDKGNTAAYLLYAYTRICSIARNAGVSQESLNEYAANSLKKGGVEITHPKEQELAKSILKFPTVLNTVCSNLKPHMLCEYLYDLSKTFTEFYSTCYCIQKNEKTGETTIHMNRLCLCEATAKIMQSLFKILGLKTVEKM